MSCADVCIAIDDCGEGNAFYTESIIGRSRKPHRCCECGETIPVGGSYLRAAGKGEGEVFTTSTCLPCAEIRRAFCCGGWIFGELESQMREQVFEVWQKFGPYDCLAKLESRAARDRAMQWFHEWRGDTGL